MRYPILSITALAMSLALPAAAQTCGGDCGGNLVVTVDELIVCVNIALGSTPPASCQACDGDGDGSVAINELVQAVGAALTGCPGAVRLPGSCRRPGTFGTAPCAPGSRVVVFRCQDRAGCLSSLAGRIRLGEGTVDADGRFSVLVDGRQLDGGLLLFEAEAEQATVYRALDLGSASSAAARVGGAAGSVTTVVDPGSEAAARLIDEIGMENFSDDGVLEIVAEVREATAAIDFSGLTAAAAAELATETARNDPEVQAALRRNATPTATATEATPTVTANPPTATHSATPTVTPTDPIPTDTASPSPTATLPPIFGPAQVLAAGNRPSAVAVADLNADEIPDIVAANANSFDVSIWLGLPAGGYAARQDFSVGQGTFPAALVVADLDGDQVPDLATANSQTDQVSVLLGAGSGRFGSPQILEVGATPSGIAAGLVDADERVDLITANRSLESVSLLLAGEEGFAPHALFGAGTGPVAVLLVDLDGDLLLDAVTANAGSGDVSVLRGDGTGAFADQVRLAVGAGPAAVAAADVNGDGLLDLATANADAAEVAVLLRTGGIVFQTPMRHGTGDSPLALAIADIDGNGAVDLVTANALSDDVSVLFGDGQGGFAAERRVAVGDQPVAIAVADLDRDGALDVVTADNHADTLTLLPGLPRE